MTEYEYSVIRSSRKTLAVEIRNDGTLLVRAPMRTADRDIRRFLVQHADWIDKHMRTAQARMQAGAGQPPLTEQELRALCDRALKVIPERVAYYAPLVGVTYGRITIRNQRTKWGSCTSAGNLNFNCLLMLAPPEVLDSVVVHELCHRLEMNHSPRFYEQVRRVFPEYDRWNRWLKENGPALMHRMTG